MSGKSARKLLDEREVLTSIQVEDVAQIDQHLIAVSFIIDHQRYVDTFNVESAPIMAMLLSVRAGIPIIASFAKDSSTDGDEHPQVTGAWESKPVDGVKGAAQ